MSGDKFRKPDNAATRLSELREGKKPAGPATEADSLDSEDSEHKAFSTISADRQQKVMLELRFKTDDAEAFPYSYLVRAKFSRSEGILLDFGVAEVRISGLNLRPLYAGLVTQRVAMIPEVDELYAEAEGAATGTVVTKIVVKEREE
jgi:hypothetical protein